MKDKQQTTFNIINFEKNKIEHLETIISIQHLNIKDIKKINVEVSGEEADTINYDVNISTIKDINTEKDILKIPIKYLIAGKKSNVVLNILTQNNTNIKKIFQIEENIPSDLKKHLHDMKIIKTRTVKNRLYYFEIALAIENTPTVFLLIDNNGNIRSFSVNSTSYEILPRYKISNPLGQYILNTEREPIFLKDKKHLITIASNISRKTIDDFILEIDLTNNKIVKAIDLTKILDVNRLILLDTTYKRDINDWLHPNSIFYNYDDNSIILSARHQGIFKIKMDGTLQWILSPHKDWKEKYQNFLLKAINSNGTILNKNIQDGIENYKTKEDEFEWCWEQHSAKIMNKTNIIVFDNGFKRNFNDKQIYSRAVIYKIDEKNMTVQQLWQYGKDLQCDFFSVCGGSIYNYENTLFVNSGIIIQDNEFTKSIIKEIDITTNKILFEIILTGKNIIRMPTHNLFDRTTDARIVNIDELN